MGEVGEEVKKLSLPEVTAPWQKFSANMLLIPGTRLHPSCAYLKLKEKEEEPYEAVAIAVKAKTVEDVKLGDKFFTLHSFADFRRIEEFLAEEAMPE